MRTLEQMSTDRMVNAYMSAVDTRIDSFVLRARVSDEMRKDSMRVLRLWDDYGSFDAAIEHMRWQREPEARRVAEANTAHMDRDNDLQQMIEEIRASDPQMFPAERHANIGFGPYDGNSDKYLAMILDYAGPDYADEETGSTEWNGYFQRFGRLLLESDDRGFKTITEYPDTDSCKAAFKVIEDAYNKWDDDTFESLEG